MLCLFSTGFINTWFYRQFSLQMGLMKVKTKDLFHCTFAALWFDFYLDYTHVRWQRIS